MMMLSFTVIFLSLSIIYGSTVSAQPTKPSIVTIPLAQSVNNTLIKQEEHINSSPLSLSVSLPTYLLNPLPVTSTTNTPSNNSSSLQLPPIANAGNNQTVNAGSTVVLNGSKSRSPGGIILGYSWRQIPTGSISLGGSNSSAWQITAPKVTADTPMRFQLNVTDNLGQTSTAYVNVLDRPALLVHLSPSSKPPISALTISNNHNTQSQVKIPTTTTTNTATNKARASYSYKAPTISPPLVPMIK